MRLGILLTILCAAVLLPAPARAEDGAHATPMEDSVARLKDSLKQEHQQQRGNAVAASLEEWRQKNPGETSTGLKLVKGLGLCIGVFLIGAALYQRMRGRGLPGNGGRMQVLERLPLTAKTALMLVECDGRKLLVAVGPDRVAFQGQPQADGLEGFELECGAEARQAEAGLSAVGRPRSLDALRMSALLHFVSSSGLRTFRFPAARRPGR